MPVLLWQAWRFIAPGLYRHEKRYAVPFVAAGVLLFFTGGALAYWSLPRALEFLVSIGGPDLVSLFSPKQYLGFVVKMMVAFGIAFQFPIVLIGLQAMGVVETPHATEDPLLRRGRDCDPGGGDNPQWRPLHADGTVDSHVCLL